jgi:hypothetical protein
LVCHYLYCCRIQRLLQPLIFPFQEPSICETTHKTAIAVFPQSKLHTVPFSRRQAYPLSIISSTVFTLAPLNEEYI